MPEDLVFESVPLTEIKEITRERFKGPLRPVVLVVDDERLIADTLAAILEISGYAAMVAYDGQSALEIAKVIPPDLLISDVVMPGMSGVELAMALSQSIPDCKVLLFSGQAATLDLLSAARAAGHDFPALTKPVHPRVMLDHVSELVPRYTSQYLA
jgi:DNA-binding response OmpR family regulator